MKNYKAIQKMNNLLNKTQDYSVFEENFNEADIIASSVDYFHKPNIKMTYPAKSYAVAIIYAYLIEKEFGTPFYESLNEADLLCHNDKYFKTYNEASRLYDRIIEKINLKSEQFKLDTDIENVKETVKYFKLEFYLR